MAVLSRSIFVFTSDLKILSLTLVVLGLEFFKKLCPGCTDGQFDGFFVVRIYLFDEIGETVMSVLVFPA